MVEMLDVVNVAFSDHRIVLFTLDLPRSQVNSVTFTSRDLRQIDTYKFSELLRRSGICTAPPISVDKYVSQLDNDVIAALDVLTPLKRTTRRTAVRAPAIWLNDEAREARRNSRRLERKYRASNDEVDYMAWRRAGRLAVRSMTSARANYYKEAIRTAGEDPKGMWNVVKKILHTTTKSHRPEPLAARRLADAFSNFIADKQLLIRRKIADHIQNSSPPPQDSPLPFVQSVSLSSFSPASLAESSRLIFNLSASKSLPMDIIPNRLLKSLSSLFAHFLTEIANRSFAEGKFPSAYKQAQITPLLKKPSLDPLDPASFRPISNLRTMSKLLERLV